VEPIHIIIERSQRQPAQTHERELGSIYSVSGQTDRRSHHQESYIHWAITAGYICCREWNNLIENQKSDSFSHSALSW
jgi:hypothetical protein